MRSEEEYLDLMRRGRLFSCLWLSLQFAVFSLLVVVLKRGVTNVLVLPVMQMSR